MMEEPMDFQSSPITQRPLCKTTFYFDPIHPTTTNQQVFLHCYNIGVDGRTLDQVMWQTAYADPKSNCLLSFDELSHKITRIFVHNTGDVVVSPGGLACCPNLQDLDIGCNENDHSGSLHISPQELANCAKLKSLTVRTLTLTNDTMEALNGLRNRLEYLRLRNVDPGAPLLQILPNFTTLKHLYLRNISRDTAFPSAALKGSSKSLTWIALEGCHVPKISKDMFAGMHNLIKLEIFDCALEEVEPNSFDDLTDLRELSLTGNRLKTLPKGLFWNSKRLTHVDLTENEIEAGSVSRHQFDHCLEMIRLEI